MLNEIKALLKFSKPVIIRLRAWATYGPSQRPTHEWSDIINNL